MLNFMFLDGEETFSFFAGVKKQSAAVKQRVAAQILMFLMQLNNKKTV